MLYTDDPKKRKVPRPETVPNQQEQQDDDDFFEEDEVQSDSEAGEEDGDYEDKYITETETETTETECDDGESSTWQR